MCLKWLTLGTGRRKILKEGDTFNADHEMEDANMQSSDSVDDLILNYDPEHPQERFRRAGLPAALKSSTGRLPGPVPWPQGHAPAAAPLAQPPAETDDLGRFRGYDAVVVTWTSAEAAALAALLTPDFLPSRWYEYRHNVADYMPLVTGTRAPFNDRAADMTRYFHSLGLYMPSTIGGARVLLFKSGLHPAYDGPKTPLLKLMIEIAQTVQPKVMITTGTGGAIGADVLLGDVVVAAQTRFDCTKQFKNQPRAQASYQTSVLPAGALAAITPDLTRLVVGRLDVAVRVRDLRVRRIAHRIPIDPGTRLHRVADHRVAHVACPAETLQFVEIGRVVEREEICGHHRGLLIAAPDFGLGAGTWNA